MHKYLKIAILSFFLLPGSISFAQHSVTIGSENLNEKAVLTLVAPTGDQGFILPVVQNKGVMTPGTSEKGMLVYDNSVSKVFLWNGSSWVDITDVGSVGAIASLNDIADVNVGTPTAGQVLQFQPGMGWVASNLSITDTDNQSLVLSGDILTIEDGSGSIDLSAYRQDISFNTTTNELSISEGSTIVLPSGGTDADADPTNELQSISKSGNTVTLSNSGGSFTDAVDDADADPTNEIQDITLTGTEISLTNGSTIDLASIIPPGGTDDQNAGEVPYDNGISGLSAADVQTALDELASSGAINTDNQGLILTGDVLTIEDGSGSIDLGAYGNDADADPTNELQTLSFNGTTNELSLSDGNSVTIPSGGTDADADPTNEIQDISFNSSTNELSITHGSTLTIPVGGTDADEDPTNELQNLSLTGTIINISDGTGIDLSPIIPPGGTDDQTLTFNAVSNILEIEDGNTVDLSSLVGTGGTDNQNLILTGDLLSIENGSGSVDLSLYGDDADADPTNEIDVTAQSGLLVGNGTTVSGLTGTADGQVATWNAGTGSWMAGTVGSGSAVWSQNTNTAFYDIGPVGIGTNIAAGELAISSNSTIETPQLLLQEEEADYSRLTFKNDADNFWSVAGFNSATPATERLNFYNGATGDLMSLTGDGKLGIGVGISPQSTLDIKGGIWNVDVDEGDLRIGDNNYRLKIGVATGGGGAGDVRIRAVGGSNRMMLGGGANDVLTINQDNVGIGESDPAGKLHISHPFVSPSIVLESTSGDRSTIRYTKTESTGFWDQVSGIRTDPASGTLSYYYNDVGLVNQIMTMRGDGRMGIKTFDPQATLDILGGQWDLNATEGDFRIGDDTYRLKIGVATGGGGAGISRIRSQGGANELMLGAGNNDVIIVREDAVEMRGEIHTEPTGNAHMLPTVYGTVSATGTILNGSGNFTVTRAGLGDYQIYFESDNYISTNYVMVLVSRFGRGNVNYSFGGSHISISTWNIADAREDGIFSFLVYEP